MKKLLLIFCLITTSAFAQFQQKPTLGLQVNWAHPLAPNAGCWLFNEGTGNKVFDLSGNGNGMTAYNSPVWVSGDYGAAIDYVAGSSQYHNINKAVITDYPFTIVCGFKVDDVSNLYSLVSVQDNTDERTQTALFSFGGGDNKLNFAVRTGGDFEFASSAITITPNVWHQGVGVGVSSTERYVYLDGGNKGSNAVARTLMGYNSVDFARLGDSTLGSYLSGNLSYVMIYNRALTNAEISLLYREPFCFMEPAWNFTLFSAIGIPTAGGQIIMIIQ